MVTRNRIVWEDTSSVQMCASTKMVILQIDFPLKICPNPASFWDISHLQCWAQCCNVCCVCCVGIYFPVTPYCGCAGDRLAARVWCALLSMALWGLVHVERMLADRGLDSTVVLCRCWVWMWVGVWMWMRVWSCELSGDAVLGRVRKLGWWISLGHGWIRGCRCVLVTL